MPNFDTLVQRCRFDQVFHDHAHYFTERSLAKLLSNAGAEYVGHVEDYHNWGSIAVAFRKNRSGNSMAAIPPRKE